VEAGPWVVDPIEPPGNHLIFCILGRLDEVEAYSSIANVSEGFVHDVGERTVRHRVYSAWSRAEGGAAQEVGDCFSMRWCVGLGLEHAWNVWIVV
jgi:hypothetical protein